MVIVLILERMEKMKDNNQDVTAKNISGTFSGNNFQNLSNVNFLVKISQYDDDSKIVNAIQNFTNIFFDRANMIYSKIENIAKEDHFVFLNPDLFELENFAEGSLVLPNFLVDSAKKFVRSLWNFYRLVSGNSSRFKNNRMKNEEINDYSSKLSAARSEPIKIQREFLRLLRDYIHGDKN